MFTLAFVWPPVWGIALAIGVSVLFGAIGTGLASHNAAAIGVSPDHKLLVRPVGLMRMWALSTGIDCTIDHVIDVGVAERKELKLGFRAPGTHIPRIITAGTFRSKQGNALWLVGRQKKVLVIELRDEKWRYLILGVEDPDAATEALRAALNRER